MKIFALNIALTEYEYTQLLKKYEHDVAIRGFLQRAIDTDIAREASEIEWSGKWDKDEESA